MVAVIATASLAGLPDMAMATLTYIYPPQQNSPEEVGQKPVTKPHKMGDFYLIPSPGVKNVGKGDSRVKKIRGFGQDIPLIQVLRAILPKGWSLYGKKDVNWKFPVTFSGDEAWTIMLDDVLKDSGNDGVVDWDKKEVFVSRINLPKVLPVVVKAKPVEYVLYPGKSVAEQIIQWGEMTQFSGDKSDHWTVIWQVRKDFPVFAKADYGTNFLDAVKGILKSLRTQRVNIRAKSWGNHVLVIRE